MDICFLLSSKAGVPALKYDYNLEKYAMIRSAELYTDFSHGGKSENGLKYVTPYHDLTFENIYQLRCDGYLMKYELPSATKINQCWVDSSGHYATMINKDVKYIGIGVYRCEKGTFAVQYYGDGADM